MPNNYVDKTRLDAGESAFFKRELEVVKTKTYDTKNKTLKAKTLIPISTEGGQGATQITWQSFTGVGFAKIIADYAKDFPRVDLYAEEHTVNIKDVGDSYGYSLREIRASQFAGKQLDVRKAALARRAVEQEIDSIGWNGNEQYNIQGLINYPGITEYVVPDGAGLASEWTTKTPDEIVADLCGITHAVVSITNGIESPDTMIMPLDQYLYIKCTRMTDGNDVTVFEFFMKNNGFIQMVDWVNELKGAGTAGSDRFMVYPRDEDHLTFEIPSPYEQFAPQQKGLEFEIMTMEATAGVIVYYTLSLAYGDGI